MKDKKIDLDSVLDEFLSDLDDGDTAALARYVERFPELETELAEAAGFHMIIAGLPDFEYSAEEDAVLSSRAASVLQNVLHDPNRAQVASTDKASGTDQVESLVKRIREIGETPDSVGRTLRLSEVLVRMVDSREVSPSSIPGRLYDLLSKTLGIGIDALVNYQSMPPAAAAGHYKADQTPEELKQTDFRTLVAEDPFMSKEDKEYWLAEEPSVKP